MTLFDSRDGRVALAAIILPAVMLGLAGCGAMDRDEGYGSVEPAAYERIVSMSPAVTEMLFELGLGDRVVGVTTFCNYPEEAKQKTKIGGFHDASYEAMFSLRPDLVVSVDRFHQVDERLRDLGLCHLAVETETIPAILKSIRLLGEACEVSERAEVVVSRMENGMAAIQERARGGDPRRVLVSVGRNMGTGKVEDLYVAGNDTLYGEMISRVGGINAYEGNVPYARISREGLLRLNPEVVVDLIPDLDTHHQVTREQVMREWGKLTALDAVKNQHVYIYGGDYVCVPGPRISQVLMDIAIALNPDIRGTSHE